MPSTMKKLRDLLSAPPNSILKWPWLTGGWRKPWGRTITILPILTVTKKRMKPLPELERLAAERIAQRESLHCCHGSYVFLSILQLTIDCSAERYRNAMGDVVTQFPDDLDAATLFAEAGMDLHPWGLWRKDGTPEGGTEDIIAALESVLKRDPNHMGAIHYYIHAVEASPNPERALAAANRLAALAPAAGHLVHMPGHVYIRTGDFEAAVKTNQLAASRIALIFRPKAWQAFIRQCITAIICISLRHVPA